MLDDLTRSLAGFLSARIAGVEVRTEHPVPAWSEVRTPFLALALRRVAEVRDRREADWSDVRDDAGRVVGRLPPSRWFRCTYHVVAMAPDAIDEHRLLGAVLSAAVSVEALPEELLAGVLAGEEEPVGLSVAHLGVDATSWWAGVGLAPRAGLELAAVAPVRPVLDTQLGPPAVVLSLGAQRLAGEGGPGVQPGAVGERRWTRFTVNESRRSDDS